MDQPLLVLLLPRRLERFDQQERARALLQAAGAVAVDPSRLPVGRLPSTIAAGLAIGQAKRMRLPGSVAAIAIFHPLQFYLAGALLARHDRSELWYGRPEGVPGGDAHLEPLHATAIDRARLTPTAEELFDLAPLRMAELGIPFALSGPPSAHGA